MNQNQKPRKRQTTRWHFISRGAAGTFTRIGYVHNKSPNSPGCPEDVIRVQTKSVYGAYDRYLRPDEAAREATGLAFVVAQIIGGQLPNDALKRVMKQVEEADRKKRKIK